MLGRLLYFSLFSVSIIIFTITTLRFFFILKKGRSGLPWDSLGQRLLSVLIYWFGQRKVGEPSSYQVKPGVTSKHHWIIFWGFLIITIGTLEFIIHTLFPSFSYRFLGSTIYTSYKWILDLFNILVFCMILYALFRRIFLKPPLIPMSLDAALILFQISLLLLTHFSHQASLFIVSAQYITGPISKALGEFLKMHFTIKQIQQIGSFSQFTHAFTLFFFLNYIPYSKHIHILGSLPNIFFRNLGAKGVMPKIDLEREEEFGVGHVFQFGQKSLLDTIACTECGRCSNFCPAHLTHKPLSPMHLIHDIRQEMLSSPKSKSSHDSFVGEKIKDETLWACTTCGACQEVCPVFIEHPLKIQQMKTHLVLSEGRVPIELQRTFQNLERNQNPWGIHKENRMEWAQDLKISTVEENPSAEYLLFVGCAAAFDERVKKSMRALVEVLHYANVSFAVLGKKETCSGDPARRAGNEFLFQQQALTNIEQMHAINVKKIITNCPHCFHTIKNEYPAFGGYFEVFHHSQIIEHLVNNQKLILDSPIAQKLTYHDSCYLGRWNNNYNSPREILKSATQNQENFIELPRSKQHSFCCGAGGGRMWQEEKTPRINSNRALEIIQSDVGVAAVACPFCTLMLEDGIRENGAERKVQILDVAEVVRKSIKNIQNKKLDINE